LFQSFARLGLPLASNVGKSCRSDEFDIRLVELERLLPWVWRVPHAAADSEGNQYRKDGLPHSRLK